MAIIATNSVHIARFANALYGQQLGSITNAAVQGDITAAGGLDNALNAYYAYSFGGMTTAKVTSTILTNLGLVAGQNGLTQAAVENASAYILATLNAAAPAACGAAVKNILNLWANIADDANLGATYGAAATAWDATVASAQAYTVSNATDISVADGANLGQTITLKTIADIVGAGSGNDNIFGAVDFGGAQTPNASVSTFTASDQINGGGGNDTLSLTLGNAAGGSVALPAASVTGVETINLRNVSGQTLTADASLFSGVTTIVSDRSSSPVTLTNVAKTTAITLAGDGNVTPGALTATYSAGTTSATVNVSGGTPSGTGAVTVNGNGDGLLKTLTINSSGAANTVGGIAAPSVTNSVVINAATNLKTGGITNVAAGTTISASGAATTVDLGALAANVTKVDGSGLTAGGVKATLVAGVTSFKGGAGNDTVTTASATLTSATATVDGGTGTNTLVVVASTDIATATEGAKYTNFQTLSVGAFSQDASLVSGITAVSLAGAASSVSNLSAAAAGAVTITTTDASGSIALKDATGTSDVLGLTLKTSSTTVSTVVNATGLTANGFETLNLAASSGGSSALYKADGVTPAVAGTDFDQVTFTSASSLQTLKVSGAYAVDVNASAGAAKLATLDASANTAGVQLEVGGQTVASTVTGTAAADAITVFAAGAGGSYTINAGAGNDTVTIAAVDAAAATINGGDGTDTLAISDTGALSIADNTFRNVSNVEKVTLGTTAAALVWTVGGFANTLATSNGGVLDVSAKALTTTASAAIDASGLTGTNSLKLSISDAVGAGTGAAISVVGSSAGTDSVTIKAVASGVGTVGAITVNESANTAGVTIDASGVTGVAANGNGAIALTGSKAADVIKGGALAETITGGKGADTITLLSGHTTVQTLTFGNADSTDAAYDTVSNFVINKDVLDFVDNAALLGNSGFNATQTGFANVTANVATGLVTFGGTGAASLSLANSITAVENLLAIGGVAGTTAAFNLNGNSYVVEYNATSDVVVQLTGVTTTILGISANNVIVAS
jgi:hypothetical protein